VLEPWFPQPCVAVEMALKQFGGWSKMFGQSKPEWDKQNITYREGEIGFWVEWTKVKFQEQLKLEVENACRKYRKLHGAKPPLPELRVLMARALLKAGWKPETAVVLTEMRALRKAKLEDLKCLKRSLSKKRQRRK